MLNNRVSLLAVLLALFVAGGLLAPSTAQAQGSKRARHQFKHASTCGDYEQYAYNGGKSNKARTTAVAGRYSGEDDGCAGEYTTGHWVSDSLKTKATFRWILGGTVIRKKVHKHCGTVNGCSDLLQWKHAFTIDGNGVRHYQGKRLVVSVTFSAPGCVKKTLRTNPAYDSGYYARP